MSPRTKKALVVLAACALVVGGGWWAYYKFTTVPPPDLKIAGSDEVVDFLGNGRGFARMSIPRREEYLVRTYQRFSRGEARAQFYNSLQRMPRSDRQVFLDAFVDIGRVRVMEHARNYNQLTSRRERSRCVDRAIRHFERMRGHLGGRASGGGPVPVRGSDDGGRPALNLGDPFRNDLPRGSDELAKVIVTRTNARERAEAGAFIDALTTRYQQLKDPAARRRFDAGG